MKLLKDRLPAHRGAVIGPTAESKSKILSINVSFVGRKNITFYHIGLLKYRIISYSINEKLHLLHIFFNLVRLCFFSALI